MAESSGFEKVQDEISEIINNSIPKSTKLVTMWSVSVYKEMISYYKNCKFAFI